MAQKILDNPKGIREISSKSLYFSWNRKLLKDKSVFYLCAVPLFILLLSYFFSYFQFIPSEADSARYMISTLIQSEAAILAIIITLSLVAVQETASSYSPRVTEIFRNKNPDFWILILIYIFSMTYGSFILKQIESSSLHPYNFGKYSEITDLFNTVFDIQNAIWFTLFLGIFAFFFLIPYTLKMLKILRPAKVIDILVENITEKRLIYASEMDKKPYDDYDPLHPIIDIMRSSLLCCDYQTAMRGLNSIHNSTDTILKSKNIDEKYYKEISLSLINHFTDIGIIAAREKYEDFVLKVISIFINIAHEALIRKLEFVLLRAIEAICLIGKTTAERRMVNSTVELLESLKELSDEIIEKRQDTFLTLWDKKDTKFLILEITMSFIEIQKIAIEQKMTLVQRKTKEYEQELYTKMKVFPTKTDSWDFLWLVLKANYYLKYEDKYNKNKSLKYINQALEIDPLDPDALVLKGDILFELERETEALIAYDVATKVKPDDIIPLVLKGNMMYKLEMYYDALKIYNAALDIDDTDAFTWYNKASVYLKLKQYDSALKACKKALEIKPDYNYALMLMETINMHLNEI